VIAGVSIWAEIAVHISPPQPSRHPRQKRNILAQDFLIVDGVEKASWIRLTPPIRELKRRFIR
jgi:hypothetical protein